MTKRTKALLAAAVALPMALGGVGTAYATHYQDRALPGSTLAGTSVSGLARADLVTAIRDRADAVTVEVTAGDSQRTASLADLGYGVDAEATADAVLAANGSWSSYATSLYSERDLPAVVTSDDAVVAEVATRLVEDADRVGRDAAVRLSEDEDSFTVRKAVPGFTVDPATFQDAVRAAAASLSSTSTVVEFVERDPAVTTADARKVAKAANAMVGRSVVVSDGSEDHEADAATKASWVTVPLTDGVPGMPTVDAKAVTAWVDGLADEAHRDPSDGLRNVSPSGDVLSVVTEAVDGRSVNNAEGVTEAVVAAMGGGRKYAGSFEYDVAEGGYTDRTVAVGAENLAYPAAPGEKWVDVNLSNYTITGYVGADVVQGPIKMVDGAPDTPTVTGVYRVYHKTPMMTMRGQNADGSDYETEDVPWVSFFHRGYALHGAYWRDSFGYSGSHGCINLPVEVAKWFYDFAPIGTPVASHH
ncbi:L,D-transpeptidase [Phycicoccus sp. BSK3Z-2]|uniref:L,D-transpeptidase n=1 Tax=Phycicoccus avicenniae TaxID=2828860 RepID=A0A941D6F2_9MICO|nr:L,D-transpeptidase family protein [Phycicoccus avicenniae]MBR7742486.1 L,D-transpeptidase [Phycicoccus avicenniae]